MKIKRYNSIYRRHVDPLKVVGGVLMTLAFLGLGILIASLVIGAVNNNKDNSSITSSNTSDNLVLNNSSSESKPDEDEITVSRDGAIRSAFLTLDVINNPDSLNAFINDAKQIGITDVVITVKDNTGLIYFDSNYEKAKYIKNESENLPDLKNAVEKLHQNGIKAVAQMHCFMDRIGTRIKNAGVLYSENHGVVWLDEAKENGGKSWLNPYSEEARNYLKHLCDEVVDIGFDVIMLDSVRFPDGYQLYAYYGTNLPTREECLKSFVSDMKHHLAQKDTEMWLYASAVSYVDPSSEKFSENIFLLGSDVVMFSACPCNFPTKLAFDMTVIDNPVQTPKQTVTALIKLAQQKVANTSVRIVPVLQAYTDSTIPNEYNLQYTNETVKLQFEALEETALTDYAVYSQNSSLQLLK